MWYVISVNTLQVPEIRDEESYAPESGGSYLDWKPSQPVSRSSSGASSRKCISALPARVTNVSILWLLKSFQTKLHI